MVRSAADRSGVIRVNQHSEGSGFAIVQCWNYTSTTHKMRRMRNFDVFIALTIARFRGGLSSRRLSCQGVMLCGCEGVGFAGEDRDRLSQLDQRRADVCEGGRAVSWIAEAVSGVGAGNEYAEFSLDPCESRVASAVRADSERVAPWQVTGNRVESVVGSAPGDR